MGRLQATHSLRLKWEQHKLQEVEERNKKGYFMESHDATPIQATSNLLAAISDLLATYNSGSVLGRLFAHEALLALVAPEYILHSLNEFPAYVTSPTDREDEPGFVIWLKRREHFVAPGKCFHGMLKGFCSACVTPVLPAKVKSKRLKRINPGRWGWKPGEALRPAPTIKLGDTPEPSVWPERWYVGGPRWVEGEAPIEPTAMRREYREYSNVAHPAWHTEKLTTITATRRGDFRLKEKTVMRPCLGRACSVCNNGSASKLVARPARPNALKQQIVSPARCVHGIILKAGESKSGICEPCRRGYPAWELTRTFCKLDEISRVETISLSSSSETTAKLVSNDPVVESSFNFVARIEDCGPEYIQIFLMKPKVSKPSRVLLERGGVIEGVPFGPVERWMGESLRPTSMLIWSEPYWWSGELRESFEEYLLRESSKPKLAGLVTTTEAREKQIAERYRTEPALLFNHHRNLCPNCNEALLDRNASLHSLEYLPMNHDAADGVLCEEYQETRDLEAQYQVAKQAETLAAFFEHHGNRLKMRYAKQRELQALAYSLGDEWCAAHPEMAAQLTFPDDCEAIEHGKAAFDLIGGPRVNLRSWTADRSENDFNSGTYEFGLSLPTDKDHSIRDVRGGQRRRGTTIASKTYKICLECRADLTAKRSDAKRCENCRKSASKLRIKAAKIQLTKGD
jgi:hypothetical protein